MTLQQYATSAPWADVSAAITKLPFEMRAPIEAFRDPFLYLCACTPVPPTDDMKLEVYMAEDLLDGGQYPAVHGITHDERWALEWTAWDKWAALEVVVKDAEFSDAEILALCLWEMTFAGFTEAAIAKQSEQFAIMGEELAEEIAREALKG
jgi:hypothetical protein